MTKDPSCYDYIEQMAVAMHPSLWDVMLRFVDDSTLTGAVIECQFRSGNHRPVVLHETAWEDPLNIAIRAEYKRRYPKILSR
jgi:hypothetical protein